MGIGTWSWGDREGWGTYDEGEIYDAFTAAVNAGINFFDTAEVYGGGESERMIGRFLQKSGSKVVVATKFTPFRKRLFARSMRSALNGSLDRLHRARVELYQLHWQTRWVSIARWMAEFARAQRVGKTAAVGVSNYSLQQLREARSALARYNVNLASLQVEYSLLNRGPEMSGLLEECAESGITMIAYSPLAMGLLTGKYSASHPPTGTHREKYSPTYIENVQPLASLLREIGGRRGGKSASQVALNWVMRKGAVPIPGVKHKRQAEELVGALGWELTSDEVHALDEKSSEAERRLKAIK